MIFSFRKNVITSAVILVLFFQADNEDNDYDYCSASDDDTCPFYGKAENEIIEI